MIMDPIDAAALLSSPARYHFDLNDNDHDPVIIGLGKPGENDLLLSRYSRFLVYIGHNDIIMMHRVDAPDEPVYFYRFRAGIP